MDLDDAAPKKKPDMVIGEDLAAISVSELEHRIHLLEVEIARIRDLMRSKQASKAAADAFFQR